MKKKAEKVSKDKSERDSTGVEGSRSAGVGMNNHERSPLQSIDDYQCSGNLEIDLLELGKLLCVKEISDLTPMSQKGGTLEGNQSLVNFEKTRWCPKPWLHVELETDDPRSVNLVKVFGWTLGGMMVKVFNKILPSLDYLKSLHFWRVGLTEETLTSLKTTMSLCTNLRTVVMEGNPLQEQSFHLFMSKDSTLAHLSLRHNHIGEEGARLIGSALSANRNLLSLNLGFNFIGDAGARHIAKGLRLNRSLLCLSLSNNGIGDAGAASLAEVLGPFPLTHEEVVERRKLLISIVHPATPADHLLSEPSSSSLDLTPRKETKSGPKKKEMTKKTISSQTPGATAKKDEQKVSKKGRGGKSDGKDRAQFITDHELTHLQNML
ncbi:leucine-rich repeat-containing protein 71 isoform X2 [Denticeps clupeoides]|uniref:leucine-rich repeat-containing protein 71 isoform X2 n=1 Tax=Denticeps clupeoides TaxID=299321 RepID=UPI0010A4EE73|nr:leucine-rich repeat-containing protein 71 isoform X2 [Denticeps clupeoides]